MRYMGVKVGKRHDAHRAFVEQRVYGDRQILYIARRHGLQVTRPNGDRRARGSRRLDVVDPTTRKVVWRFAADLNEAPTRIAPIVISRF